MSITHTLAKTGPFTRVYERIQEKPGKIASKRVSAMIGEGSADDIETFIEEGVLENKDICRYESDKKSESGNPIPVVQKEECLSALRQLWETERAFAEEEIIESERSVSFSKWWDGYLDNDSDIDAFSDIHLMDKQLFGENAKGGDVPKTSKGMQRIYNLFSGNFRMPADSLPFKASEGCGSGETSLYGGILCIPKFCTDFMCVRVTAIPGRKAKESTEKSIENMILTLSNIANTLTNAKQLTPTVNKNHGHWWSGTFNFLQALKTNINIEGKSPLILSGMNDTPELGSNKQKLQEEGGEDKNSETETTDDSKSEEKQDSETIQNIWKELDIVKRDELEICSGGPNCNSEDILQVFVKDCKMLQTKVHSGEMLRNILTCGEENEATIYDLSEAEYAKRIRMMDEMKAEFFVNAARDVTGLFDQIISFEEIVKGISIARMQDAKNRCGGQKEEPPRST